MIKPELIDEQCNKFTRISGVKVTQNAQRLLFVILNGIEEDPHPYWQIENGQELRQFSERYVRDLPEILERIFLYSTRRDPRLRERKVLTTFDLAHQMSWIVSFFCGIRKL